MRFVLFFAFVFSPVFSWARRGELPAPPPSWKYVESRLKADGFTAPFIAEMKETYEKKAFAEVLRLNVLLFLKKSDYHGVQVSPQAAAEVRAFSASNRAALEKAEKQTQVPATVVASLLWLESRHGQNVGRFHVPSVYLHLLQAPRKSVVRYLKTQTYRFADKVTAHQKIEIAKRADRKATWALEELHALEQIQQKKWKVGSELRGSFAGAFGLPQFIPSSYVRWAQSAKPPAQPNLMDPADAILSVAHYLKENGWKRGDAEAHVFALMKYNNSRDYANAILDLASKLSRTASAGPVTEQPL